MWVNLECDPSELGLVEAGITLALRRPVKLELKPLDRLPENCKDFVEGFLRTGPKTKSQIKDYIERLGYARTGGGPTVTDLVQEGRVVKLDRALYGLR